MAEVLMFDSWQGQEMFLFPTASRPALETTHLPIQKVPGALSPAVKRLGREAGHSPPSSAEVKDGGANVYFHFPTCLHGVVLN
jgi:hypothetical protein